MLPFLLLFGVFIETLLKQILRFASMNIGNKTKTADC